MSADSGMQDFLDYPRFREQDLAYPDRLLLRLREARDPVSEYLRKCCDPDMARLIEEFDRLPAGAEVKWKVLVNGLNRLLEDPHLFDEDRFAQVKLRYETQKLLNPKLNNEELLRCNRLLLEDAYPEEIERSAHNPFPGLRPFETDEYHLFFGRDGQSDELIERLGRTHFLAVVGTSGSGKSSLVRAVLLPALYGGLMAQASSAWRVALFRPGDDPIGNLAAALGGIELLGVAGADALVETAMIETTLRRSALGLIDAVRQARLGDHESVLVVVDQFEELFRFKEAIEGPEDDATAFVKLLLEAGAQRELPIYVVITMRSDYLGDCAQFRNLPEAINLGQYLIPRMTRDERREAITGPVAVAGGEMTVPLINLLLNDVGDNPDQLPILQHALMRSWNHWQLHKRNGQPLDIEDYEAVGGMERSLSNHAHEAYGELDGRQQEIAAKVFKALTEKGTDNREIRRPTPLRELCAVAEASEEEVISIIETFRGGDRSFLMPPEDVTLDADTVVDISHESLIRNWLVLGRWVGEEAESARMYRRLADAAKAFGGSYLPDSLLDSALDWRERNQPNAAWAERYRSADQAEVVFEEVMAFIDGSRDARAARIQEDERRRNEEVVRQRRELEQAAALAEKERRLAEFERQQAEDRATAQQGALELTQAYAEQQRKAAQRLRRFTFALVLISLLALFGAGAAVLAFTRARNSEARAIKGEREAVIREKLLEDEIRMRAQADMMREKAEAGRREAEQAEELALKTATTRAQEAEAALAAKKAADIKAAMSTAKDTLNRDALEAFQRYEFARASRMFSDLAEMSAGDLEGEAWAKYNLGSVFLKQGRYDAAAQAYSDALLRLGGGVGAEKRQVSVVMNGLAQVYRESRRYSQAEQQYKELLGAAVNFPKDDNEDHLPFVAEVSANLGDVYREQGKFVDALKSYDKAVQTWGQVNSDSLGLADRFKGIARFYIEQDQYEPAEQLYLRAYAIWKKHLGPWSSNFARDLEELATMYRSRKRYDEAEKYYREARDAWETQSENTEVALKYRDLARFYQEWGKTEEASKFNTLADEKFANALNAVAAYPTNAEAVETLLPESGVGYVSNSRGDDGYAQYGRAATIRAIITLGVEWKRQHPLPFSVGHLSRKGGGPFPPHSNHRDGTEFDLRPLRTDGLNQATTINDSNYSPALTKELVMLIKQMYPNAIIFFNDRALVNERLTRLSAGFDNHLHVRLP